MSLIEKINSDLKRALIAKDAPTVGTLRFLKSAVQYAAIERKTQSLSDAETQAVIQKQIKQRRESVQQFERAGRSELAAKEKREIEILESYLPKQLSDAELERFVQAEVKAAAGVSKKDFGRLMKLLTEKLAGQAEARRIGEVLGRTLV